MVAALVSKLMRWNGAPTHICTFNSRARARIHRWELDPFGLTPRQRMPHRALGLSFSRESFWQSKRWVSGNSSTVHRAGQALPDDSIPDTVKDNVKNVQGWKGGAERGFFATYSDCIHLLTSNLPSDLVPSMTKVLTAGLKQSFTGGRRYGMLVPVTYFDTSMELGRRPGKEEMKTAHMLGWSVEFVRAAFAVTNQLTDTTSNGDLTQNINLLRASTPATDIPSNDALAAASGSSLDLQDAMILENSAKYLVLQAAPQNQDPAKLGSLLATLTEATIQGTLGRTLELQYRRMASTVSKEDPSGHLTLPDGKVNLRFYHLGRYKTLIKTKVCSLNLGLPVSLALCLANVRDQQVHESVHSILTDLSIYQQSYLDYNRFYKNGGVNPADVAGGRLTWQVVYACQMANADQMASLQQRYGSKEPQDVEEVLKVFNQLNIKTKMEKSLQHDRHNLQIRLQSISKLDKMGISTKFFLRIADFLDLSLG